MGKQINDRIEAETLPPIVLNPKTVNTFKDPATLGPNELQTAQNIIFDNVIIEKVPGAAKINTSSGGGATKGLHRAYGPTSEKVCLKLDNGILRSGLSAFGTSVLTGLSTTQITPFVNTDVSPTYPPVHSLLSENWRMYV